MTGVNTACPGQASTWGMDRRTIRRTIAGLLVVAGMALMWFAPETLLGAVTVGAGFALEVLGVRLDRAA